MGVTGRERFGTQDEADRTLVWNDEFDGPAGQLPMLADWLRACRAE